MAVSYDTYYQTNNYFGEPYSELMEFFNNQPKKKTVLDLGCGQGRDAIALGRLGFEVVGVDHSKVGVDQMNQLAKHEKLNLTGIVGDIYAFPTMHTFDYILLDSMLHFAKKDRDKEIEFLKCIINKIKKGAVLVICIQDSGKKVSILKEVMERTNHLKLLLEKPFEYTFQDSESEHISVSDFQMIAAEKE